MDIKAAAEEYFAKQKALYANVLSSNTVSEPTLVDDLLAILDMEKKYQEALATICASPPPTLRFDGASLIRDAYKEQEGIYAAQKQAVDTAYGVMVKELQDKHTNAVAAATTKATDSVKPLIEKHARLMGYKEQIEDICYKYSVSPGDIQISENISAEEFDALLDAAIEGCESFVKKKKAKFNPINLLYKPLEWEGKLELQIIAIVIFAFLFHFIGGLFAVAFFASMIMSTVGVYKRLDKLKIAESMMYTPNFDKFMKRDELDAIPDVDTSEADEWKKSQLERVETLDPTEARSKDLIAYAGYVEELERLSNDTAEEMNSNWEDAKHAVNSYLTQITAHKDKLISNMKTFGSGMLDDVPKCAPSHRYVLGKLNGVVDQRFAVPDTNYAFTPVKGMLEFLKLMLANAILDIKEKHLTVTIVDTEGLGRDFSEFLQQDKDLHDYIKVITDTPDNIYKEMRSIVTENIRLCGETHIDEVNRTSEEKGMVTRDYNLVIFYSGHKDMFDKPENQDVLVNSFRYGVSFWLWGRCAAKGVHSFKKPYSIEGILEPYPYTPTVGAMCTKAFADAVVNSKDGSIDYYSSIQEKYIPREKWGTWSTNKGIELNFGLADGDPTKGYPMTLGDANVHLLMAGQSGAGKSAAINQMLLSLLTKYSPKELMLVMIDFKNVEFSTFTVPDPKSDGKLSIIPHAKIMAGTKDGEYALSIFDYLIGEMENRQKLFGAVNQKKLEDYNNLMKEQGTPERMLPRVLLLIDEFQVMFTEVDPKIVTLIQDRIRSLAKLARAFGCHMWFTSQSMSGTMSEDVKANFSMRAALRCTKDVSTTIIGNDAAGTIKAKFGYLYTNDSTGQDPTRNTLWRVPFVSTKNILKTMNEAAELYKSQGMEGYHAPFYDEDQRHKDAELFAFYADNKDKESVQNHHLMVLGERTNFSLNNAPMNFYCDKGDFQNILVGGSEDSDLLNMCRTFMDNCQAHNLKYIISCADDDAHQLLELDTRLKGPFLKWSYPSIPFEDWVDADKSPVVQLIAKRMNSGDTTFEPVYVILYNWDKYPGFGVGNGGRNAEKMIEWFRLGPSVDVHFILMIKSKAEINSSAYAQFKHKMCCLSDSNLSFRILDNDKAAKLNPKGGFALYRRGNEEFKFKIYQHEFSRKLADKELTL